MSYNVSSIEVVEGKCTAHIGELRKWRKELRTPEICFLDSIKMDDAWDDNASMDFELQWSGEGSGSSFDDLKVVMRGLVRECIVRVVWEGGDTVEHYRLVPGKEPERVKPAAGWVPAQ